MIDKELKNMWTQVDKSIPVKSKKELEKSLLIKTKHSLQKLNYTIVSSVIISTLFLIYLIYSAWKMQHDQLFLINNILLAFVVIAALIVSVLSLNKIQRSHLFVPLKTCLSNNIKSLNFWLNGPWSKIYLAIIPFIYIPVLISVSAFLQKITIITLFQNFTYSLPLITALPFGLLVAFVVAYKIRHYQKGVLNYLQKLHNQLCNDITPQE